MASTNPISSNGTWKRLKQLSYLVEAEKDLKGPSLSEPDPQGIRFFQSAETTPFRDELHELVYSMRLVDQEYLNLEIEYDEISSARQSHLDFLTTAQYITRIYRAERFSEGTVKMATDNGLIPNLLRHAYSLTLNEDNWPRDFEIIEESKIDIGIPVLSLSGKIHGRTTGGRRGCPSNSCSGWLIGVLWETGQMMHICSEGWHYDAIEHEIQVVGGGEISARFVSPKPLGVPPLPKSQWIKRSELMKRKSWKPDLNRN
jgi:hypothetical protein